MSISVPVVILKFWIKINVYILKINNVYIRNIQCGERILGGFDSGSIWILSHAFEFLGFMIMSISFRCFASPIRAHETINLNYLPQCLWHLQCRRIWLEGKQSADQCRNCDRRSYAPTIIFYDVIDILWNTIDFRFIDIGVRNDTIYKIEDTLPQYFHGEVLQRSVESTGTYFGTIKFQVAFNLAVVWMIVFVSLSKGLRSYGKV